MTSLTSLKMTKLGMDNGSSEKSWITIEFTLTRKASIRTAHGIFSLNGRQGSEHGNPCTPRKGMESTRQIQSPLPFMQRSTTCSTPRDGSYPGYAKYARPRNVSYAEPTKPSSIHSAPSPSTNMVTLFHAITNKLWK